MVNARAYIAVFSTLVCLTFDARGEPRDPAAAQALFDEARALMDTGEYAKACPKLAESQRLDPGIGTQFHLANCYEKLGQVASAWVAFLDVASLARAAGQSDREELARSRANRLESRLPRLTIVVPEASQVEGLEVRRDDVVVREVQWGAPVPVDPGTHRITATAPGRQASSHVVHAGEGKTLRFELPVLVAANESQRQVAAPTLAPNPAEPTTSPAPASNTSADQSSSPWPYVLGGVALTGAGVGTAFALLARSSDEESRDYCRPDDPNLCARRGVTLRDEARARGNVATVGFAVGAAALAAGITLWVATAPEQSPAPATLAIGATPEPGGALLHARGNF